MSKRCLVLGGSGYLGSHICRRLLEEGCRLVTTYHRHPPQEPGNSLALACDLRDFDRVGQVVTEAAVHLGGLDAVVQAAGVSAGEYFYQGVSAAEYDRLQPADQGAFDRCMEINARGGFAACRAAAPHLKKSGGGNVVLLAAIDGIKPVPAAVHFAACQAALKGMVEALAKELGHYQICANLLALGILEGGLSSQVGKELKDAYLTHCSLKRFGKPQEVANMVAWLVAENTYLTGQTVLLDGGL